MQTAQRDVWAKDPNRTCMSARYDQCLFHVFITYNSLQEYLMYDQAL